MNIFYEIYGAYFRAVGRILSHEKLNENKVNGIISEEAFRDSLLFIPPKLLPKRDNSSEWGLLKRCPDGSLARITKHCPPIIITELQKRYLKSKLSDPKLRLFFDDDTFDMLKKRLENIKPLYNPEIFNYFDVFSDGDNYYDELYRRTFRTVLEAVKSGEVLKIDFVSGKSNPVYGQFLPLRLEYSRKNDKFRAYCFRIHSGRISGSVVINIGRIICAKPTGLHFARKVKLDRYFRSRRCKSPVKVEVGGERNGIERFMMEFSSFEKRTERDLTTGKCTVWLWYDAQDETELLIRLLGFGPVIKILGPEEFRKQAAERVKRQYELLFGSKSNVL